MQKYLVTFKGMTKEIEANSEFDAKVRATHIFVTHTPSDYLGSIYAVKKFDSDSQNNDMEDNDEQS